MHRGDENRIVYEGSIRIIPFDPDRIDEAENALRGFVELTDGEKLYVTPSKGRLSVKKLKKRGI